MVSVGGCPSVGRPANPFIPQEGMAFVTNSSGRDCQISLSPSDAREVGRLLKLLLCDEPHEFVAEITDGEVTSITRRSREHLVAKAKALIAERKRRSQFLSKSVFGEPAWDMLLALYVADFAGEELTVGKLINLTETPQTTALRWIDYLEKERLVVRQVDPDNRRVVLMQLLEKGQDVLDSYLSTLPDRLTLVGSGAGSRPINEKFG